MEQAKLVPNQEMSPVSHHGQLAPLEPEFVKASNNIQREARSLVLAPILPLCH